MEELIHQSPALTSLLEKTLEARNAYTLTPGTYLPWLLPRCTVKVLMVADGFIDFSQHDFGLSTFLDTIINDGLFYVNFQITLAHLRNDASDEEMAVGTAGIHNRITGFVFDNPAHFSATMYDEVFMFASETYFHYPSYSTRDANHTQYPALRLGNAEYTAISAFMDGGGGVFATGDHGALGKGMCYEMKRVRNMRYWDSTNPDPEIDEVSMSGARRNDTNQLGHNDLSEFDDQSDDVPQTIQPKLYRTRFLRHCRKPWPHFLLCGPNGIIRVLPDHPHEGECIVPSDLTLTYSYDSSVEYPVVPGTTWRLSPEVIATSVVHAGMTAGFKTPTVFQRFGAISAYNGHKAGVGRVVTDATWHHFININLVGEESYPPENPKSLGFLYSREGMKHLENIKAYFKNIAVWLARPSLQNCFRKRFCWKLLHHSRVIEAVTVNPNIPLAQASDALLYTIGAHARDILHKLIRPCHTHRFMLDLLASSASDFADMLDPWDVAPGTPEPAVLGWVDPSPVLDLALGAAILGLRNAYPHPTPAAANTYSASLVDSAFTYADTGSDKGLTSFEAELDEFINMFKGRSV
jgi:hypothetical protein